MLVSASILSIKDDIEKIYELENLDIDYIHLDIMDGLFVDNTAFNIDEIKNVIKISPKKLDVHLMVNDVNSYLNVLYSSKVKYITMHYENLNIDLIKKIKEMDIKVGIAIKPSTPVERIFNLLPVIDQVLVMSVEPGFGGQKFIPESVNKIKKLKEEIQNRNLNVLISVDGGINNNSSILCKESGVDMLVIGSALMNSLNKEEFIKSVK